jgi:hypothetical protein
MFKAFGIFKKLTSFLRWHLSLDQQQVALFQYFNEANKKKNTLAPKGVILVQCVEDNFYFGLFGQIVTSLRERQSIRVEQFVLRSLNVGESKSIRIFIKRRLINGLVNYKWTRLYNSFCNGIGYRSTSLQLRGDTSDFYNALFCWRGIADRAALIDLVINEVPVGDLINDSYLRCKPAPTVELSDIYLLLLIWQAYRDIRRAKKYFTQTRPTLYLTSYSTYIQHGIAVRVALQCDVPVYSFGNYQEFAKKLTMQDWVHTKNPDLYANEFSKLNDQATKLALAETTLTARMSGSIDRATAYMKKSAYIDTGESVPNVEEAAVIFLHDFYDSPHVYRGMVFPDFWEWACFTIETLSAQRIPFFVKPHPNQIKLSDAALNELIRRYPTTRIISSSITNRQLAEAGMSCAITVYGTVAGEMAFLRIPSITCAHHPHVNFEFCKTANNKFEYAELLANCSNPTHDKFELKRQSMIFYYMHNLNLNADNGALLDAIRELRSLSESIDETSIVYILKKLSALNGYKDYILNWTVLFNAAEREEKICN